MRFYNREPELKVLAQIRNNAQRHAQFTAIIGRRRVGKTELINQHLKTVKRSLYLFVERKPSTLLLPQFSEALKGVIPHAPIFSRWDDFFTFILAEAAHTPFTLVLDEFQNFAAVEPSVFSSLQKVWDAWHKTARVHLVIIGSVVGLMKKVFQDQQEPLYGRVTHPMELKPLALSAVKEIAADLGFQPPVDLLTIYGIFGGIPKYYGLIEQKDLGGAAIEQILQALLFCDYAPLREEVKSLLLQEFGVHSTTYTAIIEAIAAGKSKLSEIGSVVGLPVTSLSKYLKDLVETFDLLEREVPVTEKPWHSKRGIYRARDPFMNFWMSFVYRSESVYEQGNYRYFLERLPLRIPEVMGGAFEQIVLDVLRELNRQGRAPGRFDVIGRWWDRTDEIDLVGLVGRQATLIGECKWQKAPVGVAVLAGLRAKAQKLPLSQEPTYLLASKSGFTEALQREAGPHLVLWEASDLLRVV